jgi:MoaA/NifB/PqqE/SkfB family radical SAM enzyme
VIEYSEIPIGQGAGEQCVMCTRDRTPEVFRPASDVLVEVEQIVSAWGDAPGPNVSFFGAEPFRHPELPFLIAGSVAAGVERLGLTTDGVALCSGDNASGCIRAGVRHADITLLAGSAETHDRLAGRTGSFDAACEGTRCLIAAARESGAHCVVCGRTRVCRHNADEMPGIVLAFAEAGVSTVALDIAPTVSVSSRWGLIEAAIETGIVYGVWVSVEGATEKELGEYALHAWAPVRIRPPQRGEAT